MSNKTNHNTFYLLTTLSVYLGLVVVGASPHILNQAKLAHNSQSNSFEISSKTNSVNSKLKFKKKYEREDVLPFAASGVSFIADHVWNSQTAIENAKHLNSDIFVENDQVFTLPILPRASI